MDTAESSINSGVIVQCTDPNDLFVPFQTQLLNKLPLRNLHWKSPSRPLRSIPTLDVSLTREEKPTSGIDISTRRHQIPGLRQTPYVKLYLLRCDDKETYKEKCRKEVRQWVKQHTQTSNDTKSLHRNQENHDAFEWLIVHVVLPDTSAASQPKSSKHISLENTDSTDSVNSKSKWSGKNTSTIFDKLRADFDNSSKSSITRVVQVRFLELGKHQGGISSSEIDEQWQDITEALKSSILLSFNSRVVQYEEDIKERESQRKLPGWNFCTFFILKEGLAKGFESVGLLDDALAVYKELSIGLDLISQEQAGSDYDNPSGSLLQFSRELKKLIRSAIEPTLDSSTINDVTSLPTFSDILKSDMNKFPFDIERKRYRELILSSEVSSLDFRIYIFTKEFEILSKLALGTTFQKNPNTKTTQLLIDLEVLTTIVERAVDFINLGARALRYDLFKAWGGQEGLNQEELYTQMVVTGNIVATWTWAAITQILSKVFSILEIDNSWKETIDEILKEGSMDSFTGVMISKQKENSSQISGDDSEENDQSGNDFSKDFGLHKPLHANVSSKESSRRLTTWIAYLIVMARNVLGNLEITKTWIQDMKNIGLEDFTKLAQDSKADDTLSKLNITNVKDFSLKQELFAGLESVSLKQAASLSTFLFRYYLLFSTVTYRLLDGAGSHAAAKKLLIDLSQLSYITGQYRLAVKCLKAVLGPMAESEYQLSKLPLLILFTKYLKSVDEPDEYLQCLLVCLKLSQVNNNKDRLPAHLLEQYCNEIVHISNRTKATTVPLSYLFKINSSKLTISHFDDKDGFYIAFPLESLSPIKVTYLTSIKLFINAQTKQDPMQIELQLSKIMKAEQNLVILHFQSNITTQGWYELSRLEMQMNNLNMVYNFAKNEQDQPVSSSEETSKVSQFPRILIYPRVNSLSTVIKPATAINLSEVRLLTLSIDPGDTDIKNYTIKLQGATAGLRLYIHDSIPKSENGESLEIRQDQQGPLIFLYDLHSCRTTAIQFPYSLESSSESTLRINVEIRYETTMGKFTYFDNCSVNVILPVTVNVQDVFKTSRTYSRFTISPSTLVPLFLLGCTVEDNGSFEIECNHSWKNPVFIFPKQTANWVIRLNRTAPPSNDAKTNFTLHVSYKCLDEIILTNIERLFQSDITSSPFRHLSRLLTSHLTNHIKSSWTEQDLEVTALLSEMEVWPFEDLDWNNVLCGFDKSMKNKVMTWLKIWHTSHTSIKLDHETSLQRHLTILVDFPANPLMISTTFELGQFGPLTPLVVGQPLKLGLLIEVHKDDVTSQQNEQNFEISYEVISQQDQWLVGGRRKGTMSFANIPFRVEIILLPQRIGDILLPSLEIRCRKRTRTDGLSMNDWVEEPVEVNNKTQAKSLHVTPNLLSTTIEIVEQDSHDNLASCRHSIQRSKAEI